MKSQESGNCEQFDIALVKKEENDFTVKRKFISIFNFEIGYGLDKVISIQGEKYLVANMEFFYSMPGDVLYLNPDFIDTISGARIN